MPDQTDEITFRASGEDEFELTKTPPTGEVQRVLLTAAEILEMARRLPQYVQQIITRLNPSVANLPGLENALVGEVVQSKVGLDVYKTMVGLSLTDAQGTTMNYALSLEAARDIGTKLLASVDGMAGPPLTKQ